MEEKLQAIKARLYEVEKRLFSDRAAMSQNARRRAPDPTAQTDHRTPFAIDTDRILHSLSYTRYIDKTQVFYLVRNDHITHRVLHVQLVSRIGRTIGRYLGLNEDLIEAISLGHDLGHPPFGHDGEHHLSRLCQAHGAGHFLHAVQSVEFLEHIEHGGLGRNLTLETLDGILSHDGEVDLARLEPAGVGGFADFDARLAAKKKDPTVTLAPMTSEACVVRLADTISYVGRDIEDAIRLNIIKRSDLPAQSVAVLGETNGRIVYQLVTDLITNSLEGPHIAFSPAKAEALNQLKNFNRERIYYNPRIKAEDARIKRLYQILFERFAQDVREDNTASPIVGEYLAKMSLEYRESRSPAEITRDFIAGMTDEYFLETAKDMLLPRYRTQVSG